MSLREGCLGKLVLVAAIVFAVCWAGGKLGIGSVFEEKKEADLNAIIQYEKYASVEELLKDPELLSELESVMLAIGDDMAWDIQAEGEKLVFEFTYYEPVDIESARLVLAEEMSEEGVAADLENVAAMLEILVDAESPSVVVVYRDFDGTQIYSHEYFPNLT